MQTLKLVMFATGLLLSLSASAQSLKIGNEQYTMYLDFKVVEKPMESAELPKNALGSFAGHVVNAENNSSSVNLAFLLKANEREGVILTNKFMARCAQNSPNCLDWFKDKASVTIVNQEYKLGLLTVTNFIDWQIVNELYNDHASEFARFYPVLDRGKSLRNHDLGTFGGGKSPFDIVNK